jgi:hypothetical protein
MQGDAMTYTVDGGKHWASRVIRFPAKMRAFSLPRRDRAYVVGDHGMVFRYRVERATSPTPPNAILAPAMPGFADPLEIQVTQLDSLVEAMRQDIASAPDTLGSGAPPAAPPSAGGVLGNPDSVLADPGVAGGVLPPASYFTSECCATRLNKLYLMISAVAQSLPQFLGRYKNNNLLLAGLRMITDLPHQFGAMKSGLRAFRQAPDKESATRALAEVAGAAEALRQVTAVAFQRALPPVGDTGRPPDPDPK